VRDFGDLVDREAVAVQQRARHDGMGDEWRVVDFPVLVGVAGGGEPQRGPCDRQPGERASAAPGLGGARCLVGVDPLGHSAITPEIAVS
jgi:hypothetical protein